MVMERISVVINSLLRGGGFRQARRRISRLNSKFDSLNNFFGRAQGLNVQTEQMQQMQRQLKEAGLQVDQTTGEFTDLQRGGPISQSRAMERMADSMRESAIRTRGLSTNVKNRLNPALAEARRMTTPFTSEADKAAQASRDASQGTFRFGEAVEEAGSQASNSRRRMEGFSFGLLGAMFAAMQFSRALSGITQPALKAAGVSELASDRLEQAFLPAAEVARDAVGGLTGFLIDLPEPVRTAIGLFAMGTSQLLSFAQAAITVELALQGLIAEGVIAEGWTLTNAITSLGSAAAGTSISLSTVGLVLGLVAAAALSTAFAITTLSDKYDTDMQGMINVANDFNDALGDAFAWFLEPGNILSGMKTIFNKLDSFLKNPLDKLESMTDGLGEMAGIDDSSTFSNPFSNAIDFFTDDGPRTVSDRNTTAAPNNVTVRNNVTVNGTGDPQETARNVSRELSRQNTNTGQDTGFWSWITG